MYGRGRWRGQTQGEQRWSQHTAHSERRSACMPGAGSAWRAVVACLCMRQGAACRCGAPACTPPPPRHCQCSRCARARAAARCWLLLGSRWMRRAPRRHQTGGCPAPAAASQGRLSEGTCWQGRDRVAQGVGRRRRSRVLRLPRRRHSMHAAWHQGRPQQGRRGGASGSAHTGGMHTSMASVALVSGASPGCGPLSGGPPGGLQARTRWWVWQLLQ